MKGKWIFGIGIAIVAIAAVGLAFAGVVALLSLMGCTALPKTIETPQLRFRVEYAINADQEFHASLGVENAAAQDFAASKRFDGQMEVRDASGELRASAQVMELPAIPAGDTVWPMEWHGELTPGSYTLSWGADGYGSTAVEVTIVERNGRLYLAENAPPAQPTEEADQAARLTAQAVADLAQRLGIDADQITVQSVEATEFPDASLGVPEDGKTYAQVITPGYIIHLKADGTSYTYHAAGERVVLVPDENGPSTHQQIEVRQAGIQFEVPADWPQIEPDFIWKTPGDPGQRLGFTWTALEPPMEPEAALLPSPAQVIASEPVDLGWASGRRFTLEVYAPAAEGDDEKAPVEAVETHVLLTVDSDDGRWGYDFYISAPTAEQLPALEPALQHALETARPNAATANITIEGVQVTSDAVTVRGQSTLAEGSTIQVELHVDEKAALWWPESAYATVQDQGWQLSVGLDETTLDQEAQYTIYAWSVEDDAVRAAFPFDLTPPPDPLSDVQTLKDEVYGFRLTYPADWAYKEMDTQGPGMPEDWPVKQVTILFPQAWADRFGRSGPPKPDDPPAIPAISIEVCVGPEDQFRRAYVEPDERRPMTINGIQVLREESIISDTAREIRYVFPDPKNPNLRVVLVDTHSGFADRAAENEEIVKLIPAIVATFEFTN